MLLTTEERQRFIEWLRQDAESNRALSRQMEWLGPHLKILVAQKEMLAAAEMIVAKELSNIEEFTIT